jgi:hypothetical protein
MAVSVGVAACGGSATPAGPSQSPAPFLGPHSISGIVVDNQGRSPIANATLKLQRADSVTVMTNGAGEFSVGSVPDGVLSFTLSAPGYLTHFSKLNVPGSRTDVVLDLISTASPFSTEFYRQFTRNAVESTTLRTLNPWTVDPAFYIRTRTEDTADQVASSVIDAVERVIANSIPELTGGRLKAAIIETGADPRPDTTGLIKVMFYRTFPTAEAIGDSMVGGPLGRIRLLYDPSLDARGLYNPNGCVSLTVGAADHEIAHALGFYHTSQSWVDLHSGDGCTGSDRPVSARYHASIMYSRPPGNMDPDIDPGSFVQPLQAAQGQPHVVACRAADIR